MVIGKELPMGVGLRYHRFYKIRYLTTPCYLMMAYRCSTDNEHGPRKWLLYLFSLALPKRVRMR